MRTVTFQSVLYGAATRIGLDPDSNLQTNQAKALTEYIRTELEIAWQMAPWPEWTFTELRTFRAGWNASGQHVAGVQVYYSGAYYECLITNTGEPPDAAGSIYWEDITSTLDRYIARRQSWETNTIGEVWGVFLDDPKTHLRPRRISYWESPNGIQISEDFSGSPYQAYVEFSLPPGQFCADEWDSELNYVTGDCVYYPATGECYVALQDSLNAFPVDTASWTKQDFPFVLAKYCRMKAVSEALREDENHAKAAFMDAKADKELLDALDRIEKLRREHEGFVTLVQ